MINLLLTLVGAFLGYWLGRAVPRLIQSSGSLVRRSSRSGQLAFAVALLTPWLVALLGVGWLLSGQHWLVLPLLGYIAGLLLGRRQLGL